MKYHRIIKAVLLTIILVPLGEVFGQTRFARPDTTPNYAGYRYLDECVAAINRLKENAIASAPVWEDTVRLDTLKLRKPLPQSVVQYATTCLSKINVDTISLKNSHTFAAALLVADRDADVERMYMRLADSIANDSTRENFMAMLNAYMSAVPVRMDKVVSLYELGLLRLEPDSVVTSLMLRVVVAAVSARSGDYVLAHRIASEILAITDTLSPKYHETEKYKEVAGGLLFPFVSGLMTQEAIDSLAVSTEAYRSYIARIWKSIMDSEPDLEIGPYGIVAPELKGHFWYSNMGADGQIKSIEEPVSLFEKGKVTLIYFGQGGCHSTYRSVVMGRQNGHANGCWGEIHRLKKILSQYPNIKLVVVSNTFGTFGSAPPLEPEQEADTLANYFLGFHKLKGTQVVYKTDFIRLAGYDNRKVDSDTDNKINYTFGNYRLTGTNSVVLIDELGQIFHFGQNTGMSEYAAEARLRTVMERAANRNK